MAHPKAGKPGKGDPVKYFAALLLSAGYISAGYEGRERLFADLAGLMGEIDHAGPLHPFDLTDYYEDEMGPGTARMIVSFSGLREAPGIVDVKGAMAEMEGKHSREGRRLVNIDPGYIDYYKAVLASYKDGPQKIYLGGGVYADPVLMYRDGAWENLPWTFPDFRAGLYTADFNRIRDIYRGERRALPGRG